MIKRRIIYVIVVAIVSSLIVSGCVSAPPEAAPTPAATPTPMPLPTSMPTIAAPSPTTAIAVAPAIRVTSYPASVDGEANYTIRWEVQGAPGDISHTAVHWGYKSGGANIADYPRASTVQTGKAPVEFSAEQKAPAGGDIIYFRAHAIVDGTHVYSPEYRIVINPRYTGGGGGY